MASDYDNQQGFYFFNMALTHFRLEKYEEALWNYQLACDLLEDYGMRKEAKENIIMCQKRQLGEMVEQKMEEQEQEKEEEVVDESCAVAVEGTPEME